MSEAKSIADFIKSLPADTSAIGKSILLADVNGNPSILPDPGYMKVVNLASKEAPGFVMTLKNFTTKYIRGLPEGTLLTDKSYSHAMAWFLELKDGIQIDLQTVMIMVVKNRMGLSDPWANITFVLLPASREETGIYIVTQTTAESEAAYNATIYRILLSAV